MTTENETKDGQKTILETGKEYVDQAVSAAKAHPATTAGIAAGVVAAAAGAVYGAQKLRERSATDASDDTTAA